MEQRLILIAWIFILVVMEKRLAEARWWMYSRVLAEETEFITKDDNRICHFYHLNNNQLQACLSEPKLLLYVGQGTSAGLSACQSQFYYSRWNCSSDVHKLYKRKTPESAYVNAISSAGVIYKISYECDRGKIRNCGCTVKQHQRSLVAKQSPGKNKNPMFWSECNDHLRYGIRMTKIFLDPSKEDTYQGQRKRSIRHLITIQNNRAARKTVTMISKQHKKCVCHGPTGHCVSKVCYKWLPHIKVVAKKLYKQYQKALRVTLKNHYKLVSDEERTLTKTDLVYTERLDYCERKKELGIPGTRGRACSNHPPRESDDMQSCQVFCCDRGFREAVVQRKVKCGCKFKWCCEMKCNWCDEKKMTYRCR